MSFDKFQAIYLGGYDGRGTQAQGHSAMGRESRVIGKCAEMRGVAAVPHSAAERNGGHARHRDAYAEHEAGPHARHVAQHEDGENH